VLILELKRDEVIVMTTGEGLVVVRVQENSPPTKLAIEAPQSVRIYREPIALHPITPKKDK
jgi:sRNA-binding carbon storage regulator CsrA